MKCAFIHVTTKSARELFISNLFEVYEIKYERINGKYEVTGHLMEDVKDIKDGNIYAIEGEVLDDWEMEQAE